MVDRERSDSVSSTASPRRLARSRKNTLRATDQFLRDESAPKSTSQIVKFYEQKFQVAKETANKSLEIFSKEAHSSMIAVSDDPKLEKILRQLSEYATNLLVLDSFKTAEVYKGIIAELMKLKEDRMIKEHKIAVTLLNKLLVILSQFSRLIGYLDADHDDLTSLLKDLASSKLLEDKRVFEVCRICEQDIEEYKMQRHTKTCLKLKRLSQQCKELDDDIIQELDSIQLEAKRDEKSRRESRRMTYMPNYGTELLFDDYIDKVMELLTPAEFQQYQCFLRDYFVGRNDMETLDKLVEKVKNTFTSDHQLYVLKGFIGFLPPEVQIRNCLDIMERIWRREDAQLRAREDIWNLFKVCVRGVAKLSPLNIDSLERCRKRLSQFQQLKNMFLTKSCEGSLKANVEKITQMVLAKFAIVEEAIALKTKEGVFLSPIDQLKKDFNEEQDAPSDANTPHQMSVRDFKIIKPISRGSYGSVFLAQKIATKDIYAIKVLKKSEMRTKNQQENVRNERNVLALADNPFVVRMYYSFQSKKNLYMVMEYLNGGDCYSLLRELMCFSEEMARQYIAETVLAIGYLHDKQIVHRDLKPDNMLIDSKGHIKLTDFGLSFFGLLDRQEENKDWHITEAVPAEEKKEDSSVAHFAGTPDYVPPEVFMGVKCGKEVDWWALGCIMYEFLIGITPFYGDNLDEIFQNILAKEIMWPGPEDDYAISEDAIDLITKLLAFEPSERLGSKGVEEVKQHPWFKGIDWDTLLDQVPIMVPKTTDALDTSYFDARKDLYDVDSSDITEDMNDTESGYNHLGIPMLERFRGFSFINFDHLATSNCK